MRALDIADYPKARCSSCTHAVPEPFLLLSRAQAALGAPPLGGIRVRLHETVVTVGYAPSILSALVVDVPILQSFKGQSAIIQIVQ